MDFPWLICSALSSFLFFSFYSRPHSTHSHLILQEYSTTCSSQKMLYFPIPPAFTCASLCAQNDSISAVILNSFPSLLASPEVPPPLRRCSVLWGVGFLLAMRILHHFPLLFMTSMTWALSRFWLRIFSQWNELFLPFHT